MGENGDLDSFLKKIDDIDSLIKGMNAENEDQRAEAMGKVDDYLDKITSLPKTVSKSVNRTVINKYKEEEEEKAPQTNEMSMDAFKAEVERDTAERNKSRKENLKTSTTFKDKGNGYFKAGNFVVAVEWYSKAILLSPDQFKYYSNRAQAFIELHQYDKAIKDCELGMKLDDKFEKLYIHKGRALMFSNYFKEAKLCFEELLRIDKKHSKLVEEYLKELDKEKTEYEKESEVNDLMAQGDLSMNQLKEEISKLRKGSTENLISSLSTIAGLIKKDPVKSTAFRKFNGFNIFTENNILKKIDKCSDKELQTNYISLFSEIVTKNEANSVIAVKNTKALDTACNLFAENTCLKSLTFFYALSSFERSSNVLVENRPLIERLLKTLFPTISKGGDLAFKAIGLLSNLALRQKFVNDFQEMLATDFVPGVLTMMDMLCAGNLQGMKDERVTKLFLPVMAVTITTVSNIFLSPCMAEMFTEQRIWKISFALVTKYVNETDGTTQAIFNNTMEILINLSNLKFPFFSEDFKAFSDLSKTILSGSISDVRLEKCILLWSGLLKYNHKLAFQAVECKIAEKMVYVLKNLDCELGSAVLKERRGKILEHMTYCILLFTHTSKDLCSMLYKEKVLQKFVNWLESENEKTIGNISLALRSMTQYGEIVDYFADCDLVRILLSVVRNDQYHKQTRHNCAVTISDFVKKDERCLCRLRELHGFEILHEIMKEIGLNI